MLAIEVDGVSHDVKEQADAERQRRLESLGVRFFRCWDRDVKAIWMAWCFGLSNGFASRWSVMVLRNSLEPTPACGHPSEEGITRIHPLPGGVARSDGVGGWT